MSTVPGLTSLHGRILELWGFFLVFSGCSVLLRLCRSPSATPSLAPFSLQLLSLERQRFVDFLLVNLISMCLEKSSNCFKKFPGRHRTPPTGPGGKELSLVSLTRSREEQVVVQKFRERIMYSFSIQEPRAEVQPGKRPKAMETKVPGYRKLLTFTSFEEHETRKNFLRRGVRLSRA